MVGIFSRFSISRSAHRRTQSALDKREASPPNLEGAISLPAGSASTRPHGIEIVAEFKPLEHPTEPIDNDQPILCPQPEPSILNDGRIWKERVSSSAQRPSDVLLMQALLPTEPVSSATKLSSSSSNRSILPSASAPERNILKLLEESGI